MLSKVRHPNIVQFFGLCFMEKAPIPVLVVEQLKTSLRDMMFERLQMSLEVKTSVLVDVASALVYLHGHNPPIIHGQLTAENILLTASMTAKVGGLGDSLILDLLPDWPRARYRITETREYFPRDQKMLTHSGPDLDIFCFGHLALVALSEVQVPA